MHENRGIMPIKKIKDKERKGISKHFDSRRGAFRGFKRDYDISNSEQPQKVITPDSKGGEYYGLDERNKRLYIFEEKSDMFGKVKRKETHLREDKEAFYEEGGNQEQHFNAGHLEEKLKDHYYFRKKTKE